MDRLALIMLRGGVAIGVSTGVIVSLVRVVVERVRGRPFAQRAGWPAVAAWALGFALATFAVAGAMSIGVLVLPFAVVASAVAAWRYRALPEGATGAGLGTGLVLLLIGWMNRGLCGGTPLPFGIGGHTYNGCGGFNDTSWIPLTLAITLVGAGVVGQIMMERHRVSADASSLVRIGR